MSREKFHAEGKVLAGAVRSLRAALGLDSQEEMARKVGVSVYKYQNWELGRTVPKGEELVRLLSLCPTDELRAAFGLESAPAGGIKSPALQPRTRKTPGEDVDLLRYFNVAAEGINLLYEAAAAGQAGAKEILKDLADKLTTRAGDWRRMKYLKK